MQSGKALDHASMYVIDLSNEEMQRICTGYFEPPGISNHPMSAQDT